MVLLTALAGCTVSAQNAHLPVTFVAPNGWMRVQGQSERMYPHIFHLGTWSNRTMRNRTTPVATIGVSFTPVSSASQQKVTWYKDHNLRAAAERMSSGPGLNLIDSGPIWLCNHTQQGWRVTTQSALFGESVDGEMVITFNSLGFATAAYMRSHGTKPDPLAEAALQTLCLQTT